MAFVKASGKQISEMPLTDDIIFGLGKSLGKLHRLSSEYKPANNKRNDWKEKIESSINQFIKGYRCEYDISDDMLKLLPVFRRYANLYGYVRLILSIREKWNNEPEWMVKLRTRLEELLNRRKSSITKPI